MGYVPKTITKSFEIASTLNKGISILELGNQYIFPNGEKQVLDFPLNPNPSSNVSRSFWKYKGYTNHTYIDYNGQDGSLKIDLGLEEVTTGKYDYITNLGTLEHVGEQFSDKDSILKSQYNAFRNIHNIGNTSCVYFHLSPKIGSWPGHSPCHYNEDFYKGLIKANKYEILEAPVEYNYSIPEETFVMTIFKKVLDNSFMTFEAFSKIKGLEIV